MSPAAVLAVALASGFVGWGVENAIAGPRYSSVFGRESRVPFLPVYAAGGALVALLGPGLSDLSPLARAGAYALALTGLEGAVGLAERALGRSSWDYDGAAVDLPHALAWGAMGFGLDTVLRRTT